MRILLALFLLAAAPLARAAETKPSREAAVERFVKAYLAKHQIPGVALLVRYGGKTVLARGYGFANLEHRVPVTPDTVFQSGSMGKQFTAMAVSILADEGKLALDDPLSKHLAVPDAWREITIRHLLTHTSGLGDYPEDFALQRDYTEEELWATITAQPLSFAPGARWSYSNFGYVTLGILIRKVTGKFYGDFLAERVFRPLGMSATRIISEADIVPHRAAGYVLSGGKLRNQKWVSPSLNTTADGSLYFTILDLAKWDEALDQQRLVSDERYREMWAPAKLASGETADYGFGWSLRHLEGKPMLPVGRSPFPEQVVEHGGAWQGFATYIGRYLGSPLAAARATGIITPPQAPDRLTVVALANRAGADVRYIAHVVAGFYRPELAPVKRVPLKVTKDDLQRYAGEYRLEDRLTVTVAVAPAGDRLTVVFTGLPRDIFAEKLDASSAGFFEPDSDRTYVFHLAEGAVTGLTIFVPEKLQLRKIK